MAATKYEIDLSDEERDRLVGLVTKGVGSARSILLLTIRAEQPLRMFVVAMSIAVQSNSVFTFYVMLNEATFQYEAR